MPFEWIESGPAEIEVSWLHVETICPVSDEKELLKVRVSVITEGLGGYFDNIQLFKNLTREKLFGSEVVYIPIDGRTEVPIFGAVKDAQIVVAHIVPKSDIIGGDPPLVLELINKGTGDTICTKTFTEGVNASAYQVTDFGPVSEAASEIEFGQAVSLVVDGTLPESLLVIQWDLR